MKTVILAGGMGTRLREETEYRPKPMVEIGGRPILWHIMKLLSVQGLNDFVVCLGYKGDLIRDFFVNYGTRTPGLIVDLGAKKIRTLGEHEDKEDWRVTLVDTGFRTNTGGRLHRVRELLDGENFVCTYGDGLANVNIKELLDFHTSHGKIGTVTAVKPVTRFGALTIDSNHSVRNFSEKPRSEEWVSGGFFVFRKSFLDYLSDESVLEKQPLEQLAKHGNLKAYLHDGFWQPMDTYRETQELNELWSSGNAPWKIW